MNLFWKKHLNNIRIQTCCKTVGMYTLTCLTVFFSFLPNFVYAQSNIDGGTKNNVQMYVSPGKSFVRVIQSIGRGIRKAEDKDFVQIWDITSTCKFAKRHLTKRKSFYKEASYPFTIEKAEWQ